MKAMIHYINNGRSGIYGKQVFIEEAKRIGANRAFAGFIAKRINYGDKIYTAIYQKDPKAPNSERWRNGTADVFGYFVVDSMNFIGNMASVWGALNIQAVGSPAQKIVRSCGSYEIRWVAPATTDIKTVIEECEKQKVAYKLFLGGAFYEYAATVNGINFSRSIVWADLPEDYSQIIAKTVNELRELTNYQRI